VQWLAGTPLEAEASLRHAVSAGPATPATWVALGKHLSRTRQSLQVEAVFEDMRLTIPTDRALITLAACVEAAGRLDKAEAAYLEALASDGDDPVLVRQVAEFYLRGDQPGKAEVYLRRLLEPAAAPLELAAWARRELAVQLARRHGPEDFREALGLVERNATADGLPIADQRVKAFVLSTERGRAAEAVRLFEQTVGRQPLTADEQLLRAQICEANGSHAKAREHLLALLVVHRDNARYMAHYVRTLLQRGAVDEAELYLGSLERIEPSSPRTEALRLAVQQARGGK